MGSILCHGQGKEGGASADFFDGAEKFMDVQPINPPAKRVPALFNSRRREGFALVSPSPMVVFSFPSHPKVLYGSFRFFGQLQGSFISSAHFPIRGPYGDTPHKCRFFSLHAPGGSPHGNIGRRMMPRAFLDGKVRRQCRCACFGSPPAYLRPPDDMHYSTWRAHCTYT